MKKQTTKTFSQGTIQSLDKSLDVLCSFTLCEPEYGVSELAAKLGMYKSTVFRILKTLEERGFVVQNLQNQKYRLGFKLFDLGNVVISRLEVREVALPLMQALNELTRETVSLNIVDSDERVCIEKVESKETLRDVIQIGLRVPLYLASPGKLLLAYYPEQERERILSQARLVQTAAGKPVDIYALKKELSIILEQGYSYSNSERALGIVSYAAPIWNYENKVIAALSISGPESRFNHERNNFILSEIMKTATKISTYLGW